MGNVINIYGMSPLELLDTFRMPLSVPISIDLLLQRMRVKVIQDTFGKTEEEGHYLFGSVISASVVQPDGLFFFHRYDVSDDEKRFLLSCELAYLCLYGRSHVGTLDWYLRESGILDFVMDLWIPDKMLELVVCEQEIMDVDKLCTIFDCSEEMMIQKLARLEGRIGV